MVTQAAPSGGSVGWQARGLDADVGLYRDTKGHGPIVLSANSFGETLAQFVPQAGAVAHPQFLNAAAGGRVILSAASDTEADVGLFLTGKGGGGTLIEALATGRLAFFGNAPVAKQVGPNKLAPTDDLPTTVAAVNAPRTLLLNYGLLG